jgi:glycosyltransferase involved in cell wall biosynthesis
VAVASNEEGVSGFVLRQNHPREIAATLARIIAERARWPEIGEAARRVFRDHFSEPRFEQRFLATIGDPMPIGQAAGLSPPRMAVLPA